ncbi:MAG TPA: DUF922 domain-containing protein [Capsulimonadaceae bacterium]|nr:DUF922 domain-containing protein [Capsulimonadaceae bacterium]
MNAQVHKEASWYYEDGKRRERLGDMSGAVADYTLALKLVPSSSACRLALDHARKADTVGKSQGYVQFVTQHSDPLPTEAALFAVLNRALYGSSRDRIKADAEFARVVGRDNMIVRWKFYAVRGTDAPKLWNSMQQTSSALTNSPDVGITKWDYQWKAVPEIDADGRQVFNAAVAGKITITMPKWKRSGDESQDLVARWHDFYAALVYHEQGHQLIAEFTLAVLRLRIEENDRRRFPEPINDVCNQAMQDYAFLNDQYDQTTQHGALQGAVFPYGPS